VSLHTTSYGTQGSKVVLCHGLFGQGRNWTQHAKALSERHRVVLVDMPNHGRSDWSDRMDYPWMADQVAELLDAADPVALVGHSMGAKAAMLVALRHPELVERLVVVDMAPVAYPHASGFLDYIDAMLAIDLETLAARGDADVALRAAVQDAGVRGFLLQNLTRDAGRWTWRPNLRVLREQMSVIGGWSEEYVAGLAPYAGPTLWIGGSESPYVSDDYAPAMEALFPHVRRVTVKGAGHWVHSEKPEVFGEVLRRFVD
jgi:pimeloyl-ACP methyl ester carboxylesterase